MAKTAEQDVAKDTVNLKVAVVILVLCLVAFIGVGLVVGKYYFWNSQPITKLDFNYKLGVNQVQQHPDNPQAHIDLGWVYLQKKDYDNAEKEFTTAIDLDKNNVSAQYNLALLKIQRGKNQAAKELLESAIKQRPDYIKARATLGWLYAQNRQLDKALQEFKIVEKYYPTNANLMYQIGQTYQKKNDLADARQYYEKALKFDPKLKEAQKALDKIGQ